MKKIQMNITDQGLKELIELKEILNASSMADTIRSSLKIVKKLEEEKSKGNRLVIVDQKNKQTQIEFI